MGQQQPERLLPLAENTILDLTILFVTPRDGPGTEKWMAAVTVGEDCLRLPGRGSGARFSSRTDSRPSSQGVKGQLLSPLGPLHPVSSPRNYQHPPKGHQPPCERTGQRPLELGCGRMWGAAWSLLPLPQRDMRDGAGLATWRESHSWS
ncbi:PREDICTED: uncharacterized protein LOC105546070 [Mandrillus leucophaeus]|uniref:uncharacterized protein LOC105546070 n=1 Tax=Mandrillus leucophaeus TaxID=9568 RepID=UPI0005F3CC3C|nr:PREDICTED: uncharacterized protein LOC105546070 [Mandrillus leucophaeus]